VLQRTKGIDLGQGPGDVPISVEMRGESALLAFAGPGMR